MWPNFRSFRRLDTFTEEIFNGKLHFLCSGKPSEWFRTERVKNINWSSQSARRKCVCNKLCKTDTFITKVIQKLRNVLQALRKGSKGDSLLIY